MDLLLDPGDKCSPMSLPSADDCFLVVGGFTIKDMSELGLNMDSKKVDDYV